MNIIYSNKYDETQNDLIYESVSYFYNILFDFVKYHIFTMNDKNIQTQDRTRISRSENNKINVYMLLSRKCIFTFINLSLNYLSS